jgi:hypothetical protein
MSFVFKINEELARVAITATELHSVTRTISHFIKSPEFVQAFRNIIAEINKSYVVVTDSFLPFYQLDSEEKFSQLFDEKHDAFSNNYLMEVSKPRKYCDNVYDDYIAMRQMKEAQTTFPLLKESFARLDVLYDKWINNDVFLAMSIDGAIKLKNRLLNDIATMKARDTEDAYFLFSSAFDDFHDYVDLIKNRSEATAKLVIMEPAT